MTTSGNFLPPVNVPQTQVTGSNKHDLLSVHGLFPRESFPAQASYKAKSLEVNCTNDSRIQQLSPSKRDSLTLPELHFDRLQPTDQECTGRQSRNFSRFVAREAILDEEYWTAAWLRAEAHWESVSYMRHVDNYKRKYAEEEFYALKRRCLGQDGNSLKCFCFVAVKKEDKSVRRTVLNSIVGTLDLSVRQFVQGETYPGEIKRRSAVLASQEPLDAHKYAYIANVCVAKFARRQGIASNMLYLARDVTRIAGMRKLFVHVNADNNAAQDLYEKTGFKSSSQIRFSQRGGMDNLDFSRQDARYVSIQQVLISSTMDSSSQCCQFLCSKFCTSALDLISSLASPADLGIKLLVPAPVLHKAATKRTTVFLHNDLCVAFFSSDDEG